MKETSMNQVSITEIQSEHPMADRSTDARMAWGLMRAGQTDGPRLQPEEKIAMLARCFPVLQNKPWCDPFNAHQLDAWASENKNRLSHAALYAMQFLLWLWSSERDWKLGKFNLRVAWAHWDSNQRAAWQLWASDPYFP
jgi:hypothetical protein